MQFRTLSYYHRRALREARTVLACCAVVAGGRRLTTCDLDLRIFLRQTSYRPHPKTICNRIFKIIMSAATLFLVVAGKSNGISLLP